MFPQTRERLERAMIFQLTLEHFPYEYKHAKILMTIISSRIEKPCSITKRVMPKAFLRKTDDINSLAINFFKLILKRHQHVQNCPLIQKQTHAPFPTLTFVKLCMRNGTKTLVTSFHLCCRKRLQLSMMMVMFEAHKFEPTRANKTSM